MAPFNQNLFLLIAIAFGLFAIVPGVWRLLRGGPREARGIVAYAERRGYALVNPDLARAVDKSPIEMLKDPAFRNVQHAASDIGDIEKLRGGTGDWLAFTCRAGAKEVTVFNLTVASQRTDGNGANLHYRVAKIKAAGLPRFTLGRKSALHSLENAVEKIAGASKPDINVDARQHPDFAAHYWIQGADAATVTGFLSDAKIQFLEGANLAGTLATNANYLVYFEDGALKTEKDFDSFIPRVEKIAQNLL